MALDTSLATVEVGSHICDTIFAMSKKNQTKKHKFKHIEPGASMHETPVTGAVKAASPAMAAVAVPGRDFGYVGQDLRRLVILAAALAVFEIGLWYLLGHSGLGP